MARSIPNLSLDDFPLNSQASGGELNADGRFGLEAELVPGEPRKQVGLAHSRVPYQNHLEKVIVVIFCSVTRHLIGVLTVYQNPLPEEQRWMGLESSNIPMDLTINSKILCILYSATAMVKVVCIFLFFELFLSWFEWAVAWTPVKCLSTRLLWEDY